MSSSLPPTSAQLPRRPPTVRRWLGMRGVIWLLLLVLLGPCVVAEMPREVGRWKLAAALDARQKGQPEQAYDLLEAAMRRFPDSAALLFQRASWRLADSQPEQALADCNRAVALADESYESLELRSQFLQYVGRHADALKDLKAVEALSQRSGQPPRYRALNGLAYGQALAQVELEEALHHANQALDFQSGQPNIRDINRYVAYLNTLDTRGYILYLMGHYAAALKDMEVAVTGMESLMQQQPGEISAKHSKLIDVDIGLPGDNRAIAVMRYHRGLVLLALGREQEAEEDLARVRELIGREPDETLF